MAADPGGTSADVADGGGCFLLKELENPTLPMNVSPTKELETFVSRKVKSGRYCSASEVIRESLRLLEQEDLKRRFSFATRSDLEAKLMEGVAALDRGERVPAPEVEREIRQRSEARRKRQHA